MIWVDQTYENIKHHIAPEKELYVILISFTNPQSPARRPSLSVSSNTNSLPAPHTSHV